MQAKISGMVMSMYDRNGKDRNGQPVVIPMADMYVGHEIVKVARVNASFVVGKKLENVPVNIYSNQYGLSIVFDATVAG